MRYLRSLWGVKESRWENYFPQLSNQQGIRGIEASLSDIGFEKDHGKRFFQCIQANNQEWICGAYSSWIDYIGEPEVGKSVANHIATLKEQLLAVMSLQQLPIYINIHAGSDDMTSSDSLEFFRLALVACKEIIGDKIPFGFETHRGRILYSPWVALDLLRQGVDLYFTLDLSHWVVVTERFLSLETLEPILRRTRHVHARMATPQASQVSNPTRIDSSIRKYFESVWKRASLVKTMTLEYGPRDEGSYQPVFYLNGQEHVEIDLDLLIAQEAKRLQETFG